jgi:2-polyprenyl-6-methoxyphenol hydroxylase-like FAD-dependent oxidoreductase
VARLYNGTMAIDICIRGSGVVGKTLALLLARRRIRVGLVQSPPHTPAQGDIRAFALNAASRSMLTDLRAWPDYACAVQHIRVQGDSDDSLPSGHTNDSEIASERTGENTGSSAGSSASTGATQSVAGHTRAGQVQFDAASLGADALAWIVDASALETLLDTAVSFAPDITVLSAPQPAALTVICEGARSASRQAAGAQFSQTAYDQTAIAAVVQTSAPHQSTAWQWMQGGEVCALLPRQAALGQAGNFVALVWSVQHDHAAQLMALDDTQFCAQLQQACDNTLGDMTLTSHRATWPLQLAQAQRWVGTGLAAVVGQSADSTAAWALAGDAAHAVHPLAGQGLNLGLGDALELATVLSGKEYFRSYGDMRLLRRYERARQGDAAALRLATDGLQRLFAHTDPRVRSLRNWGMRGFDLLAPVKAMVMRRAMGSGMNGSSASLGGNV